MTAHPNGQWVKKIRGKLQYFGPWEDHTGALGRYLAHADDLHAGRPVQTTPSGITTVADVFNAYLTARESDVRVDRREMAEVAEGSISAEIFTRYRRAGKMATDILGGNRPAGELGPADFSSIKNKLKTKYRPQTMAGYVNAIKAVFSWAYEDGGLLDQAPRFGQNFTVKGLKRALRQSRRDGRKKLLTPEQVHAILDHATPLDRACILLGLNCGYGATDCADLAHEYIDRDRLIIDLHRFKTLTSRISPLWPETLAAIDAAAEQRPAPLDPADADKPLLTPTGRTLTAIARAVRDDDGRLKSATHYDYMRDRFASLCESAGIERQWGWGFGVFRHTFETIAARSRDQQAVGVIMGHAGEGVVEHYLEEQDLTALRAVVDHVHGWLWPGKGGEE